MDKFEQMRTEDGKVDLPIAMHPSFWLLWLITLLRQSIVWENLGCSHERRQPGSERRKNDPVPPFVVSLVWAIQLAWSAKCPGKYQRARQRGRRWGMILRIFCFSNLRKSWLQEIRQSVNAVPSFVVSLQRATSVQQSNSVVCFMPGEPSESKTKPSDYSEYMKYI